ncbi:MAG TPA: DUF1330 domain-containing protein [Phenylobacterium sp.]|nr:DUF1330 domain-containing protein [Phenylobacterium sp.]
MAAYLYVNIEVTDAAGFEAYRAQVLATIEQFGGRYLARGGPGTRLEGDLEARRQVLLEFPDMAALEAWYGSDAYRPLLDLRKATSRGEVMAFEGV